jgi:hypothetical protein
MIFVIYKTSSETTEDVNPFQFLYEDSSCQIKCRSIASRVVGYRKEFGGSVCGIKSEYEIAYSRELCKLFC